MRRWCREYGPRHMQQLCRLALHRASRIEDCRRLIHEKDEKAIQELTKTLKETFATNLAMPDVGVIKIQKLLGHRDINMTQT